MKMEDDLLKAIDDSESSLEELNTEAEKLEKECLLRKKVLEMMPTAKENISKLEGICEKASDKLKLLEKEWANVEDPLLKEIQEKENKKIAVLSLLSTYFFCFKFIFCYSE
jgi:Mg2+ and Co2+ transporter CorA